MASAAGGLLGRGEQVGLAHEGALKVTEVSYVHAQGFAAGEMKHGPIALIEPGTPVLVLLPHDDELRTKTVSNLEEVRARGALITAIGPGASALEVEHAIELHAADADALNYAAAVVLQLIAYHAGVARGCDVDKPRNLAKSVTVE
jgi:glucosamine--fructose-6-phosphate aminotransferase (isomerizing)